MNALHTQILTPNGMIYDGESSGVQVPGELGSFEIKKNHANIVSLMEVGQIRIKDLNGIDYQFAVSGGFVEVDSNKVTVMAESAESKEKIDVQRAKDAVERAKKRLETGDQHVDMKRAEIALKRAINRLKLAEVR